MSLLRQVSLNNTKLKLKPYNKSRRQINLVDSVIWPNKSNIKISICALNFFFQENARRAAEKKYAATLDRAGITGMVEGSQRSRTVSRSSRQRSPSPGSRSRSRSRSPMTYSRSMGTAKYSDDFDDTHASDERELSEGEE